MKVVQTSLTISGLFALLLNPAIAAPSSLNGYVSAYGATGNGTTDDTAAFNACLANNVICWVDKLGVYAVNNVIFNNGNRLIGLGVEEYGADTVATTSSRPALVFHSGGGSAVLNVAGVGDGAAIQGIFIDCGGANVSGISGGSYQLTVDETTVVNCGTGLGGSGAYTFGAHILNSTFSGNGTGIADITDSFIVNGDFSNNSTNGGIYLGDGIYLGAGSNSNSIENSRFEWNGGLGLVSYGGAFNNDVSNCIFDRNDGAGLGL